MARLTEIPARPSLRKAINAKCRECIYDPNERGTWRMQVERCTALQCPLFDFRPKSSSKKESGTYPSPRYRSEELAPPMGG